MFVARPLLAHSLATKEMGCCHMYIYVYMYIYIHAYRLFFHAAVVFYAPVQQKNKYLLYSIYIYIYISHPGCLSMEHKGK